LTLTFDLESYFRIFQTQAIPLQWLDLGTSFSVWRYIFRISRIHLNFNVMESIKVKVKVTAAKMRPRAGLCSMVHGLIGYFHCRELDRDPPDLDI